MCGIVGVAVKMKNGFTKKTEDCFFDMLFADTLRGDDSTGVVYIENDNAFGILKECTPAYYSTIKDEPELKAMWTRGKAYIGHNRKKTVGANSDENSHPFVVDGKFAMVHNGTLYNHKSLADTTVDSEALTIHLSKVLNKGYTKEKLEEALGKVYGAYAIAAYSQETNSIYLTRNKERPLALLETDEGWLWASEGLMAYWIAARNGIDLKDKSLVFIPENCLVTINLDTNKVTMEDYVPKKAILVTQVATTPITRIPVSGNTTTKGMGVKTKPELSKSSFKRFKKRYLNQRIEMYIDDYVEVNFPKTIDEGETDVILLGDNVDLFPFAHTIRCTVDIFDVVTNSRDIFGLMVSGTVVDMLYETDRGNVTVVLTDVKRVPFSFTSTQNETSTSLHAVH